MASVVLGNIQASDLPVAWRKRAKVKGDELPTVTITRRQRQTATKPPNARFGMWAEGAVKLANVRSHIPHFDTG